MEKENCCCFGKLNTGKAFVAGLVATIVMTIVMALMGMNTMKSLGAMLVGAESAPMQYMAGGLMHFVVGLMFAFIYAAWFAPMKMHVLIKGILFGTIITVVAFYGMPVMAKIVNNFKGSSHAMNPCGMHEKSMNPCGMQKGIMNPCNPCSMHEDMMNPCNPCGMGHSSMMDDEETMSSSMHKKMNPCNPCSMHEKSMNPCGMQKGMMNPCNPCNPCAGGQSMKQFMMSWVNHLVYAIVLAMVYGCSKRKD